MRPLQLPENAPELAKRRAAEYVLGLTDVAAMFGVSRQSVYEWARGGRATAGGRTVLPSLRAPGSRQEPLRFRLADVERFADEQGLRIDPTRLRLALQHQLRVGAFGGSMSESIEDRPVIEDELISESEAARCLGVSRSLLQKMRGSGRLNPAIRVEGSKYSQLDVWKVAYDQLELELPG